MSSENGHLQRCPFFLVAIYVLQSYNNFAMNIIEENSIKRISNSLEGLHRANGHYNFRCPYCGDSAKSKLKRRGWLFQHEGKVFYKCFNCDKSTSYSTFLKDWFPEEYQRYITECVFLDNKDREVKQIDLSNRVYITEDEFKELRNVQPCENNLGDKYLTSRNITNKDNFYFTENYGQLLRELNLQTYHTEFEVNEPRLLIPHFNRKHQLAYIQMRCFNNKGIRYRTYKIIEDEYKLWNLDKVNMNKLIYVTEGALDACFLQNSVAMSGSDAQLEKSILGSVKENLRIILDNEPRSPVILKKYLDLIKRGYHVFHWPNITYKDINECILAGYDITNDIYNEDNYFFGMLGEFNFSSWRKY